MPDFVDPKTVAQADQRVRTGTGTGLTEDQIRTIIDLIGNERSSSRKLALSKTGDGRRLNFGDSAVVEVDNFGISGLCREIILQHAPFA